MIEAKCFDQKRSCSRTKPMANNKEEAGKGTPRPGDARGARRTYATIDLTAAEVGGGDKPPAAASAASAASTAEAKAQGKSEGKPEAKPAEPQAKSAGPSRPQAQGGARAAGGLASLGARTTSTPWLSHLASGALGAIVVLIVGQLMT